MPAWEAVGLIARTACGGSRPLNESPLVGRDNELVTLETLYERVVREGAPAPGDPDRRGGRGQVAPPARVRARPRPSTRSPRPCAPAAASPTAPASCSGRSARCCAPSAGSWTPTPPRRPGGSCRGYVADLFGDGKRAAERAGRARGRADRPPARHRGARRSWCRRSATPSACASPSSPRCAWGWRGSPAGGRSCSPSRTSTGPTTACSTRSSTSPSGCARRCMLVCLARDELLDRRPGWGGGAPLGHAAPARSARPRRTRASSWPRCSRAASDGACPRWSSAPAATRCSPRRWRAGSPRTGNLGAAELPDTVQAVLAARLDALDPFERRLVQQAAVVGRTFWEASLAPLAEAEGRELGRALTVLQEKDILAPGAEGRLAGERELAFKHVLIRDVAYGMLPKAVRSRKHFEVGAFIEERAGDRTDEVVALLAEHYGRAAALGREGALARDELAPDARAGRALPGGGGRRRRAPLLEPRGRRALPPRARRRAPRTTGGTRADRARSSATCRCASAAWTRRSRVWQECLDWHRGQEDLERVADLHRKIGAALSHKGERKRRDRALPERHQPAQGRPAADRARAPLRGGRLALPAHRRQHARHLRVREGAAAGRAARRDARGQPRARDLRPRVRPHRRHREGAPEPGARGRARARLGRRRDHPRAAPRSGATSRSPRPTWTARASAYHEALALAERVGTLPAQVELHAWLAQLSAYCADWDDVRALHRGERRARRARGPRGQALPALRAARPAAAGARGASRRPPCSSTGPTSWPSRSAGPRSPSRRCSGWRSRCATRATTRARPTRSTAPSTSASAPACSPSRSRPPPRARSCSRSRSGPAPAREAAREAAELAERMHYPIGRAAALEARGLSAEDPAEGVELLGDRRDHLARARPAARGRPLPPDGRPAAGGRRSPTGPASCSRRRPRRPSAWACRTWPPARAP